MDGCLRRVHYLLFLFLSLGSGLAMADKVNDEWYSPLRTLTMGNVGVALNDDPDSSMFFNPAGLAHVRKASVEILNPMLEMGTGDMAITHGQLLNLSKNASLGNAQPLLSGHGGTVSSLGFSLYPNFQAQNFAFGVVTSARGAAYVDPVGALHYQSQYLVVPTLGMAAGLFGGLIKVGAAVRGVQEAENNRVTTSFANIGYLSGVSQGFGLGLDVGTQMTLPGSGYPTLGLVARNIGGTTYGSSVLSLSNSSVGAPAMLRTSYDAGLSYQSRFERTNMFTVAADYRDILNSTATETMRHVNVGSEIGVSKMLYFRAGMRSGYWTAGFGIHGKNASLELGSYADELDDSGYHSEEDRRVAIQFGNRF
jgi:hypothetical protein